MKRIYTLSIIICAFGFQVNGQDIKLNGTTSAENNQIKNVAQPTEDQDVATKKYVDDNTFSGSYSDLSNTPTLYTQQEVDDKLDALKAELIKYYNDRMDLDGDGYTVIDGDCDDDNENINPGASELDGDGIDNNCDGITDPLTIESGTMGFSEYFDFETDEICTTCDMGADAKYDLRFAYNSNTSTHARLWWNESSADMALVYDKSFEEIKLEHVGDYYFCEHINDTNSACSNTDTEPTDFFGIIYTNEGNYYAVEFSSEDNNAFTVSFRYKQLN